MADFNVDVKSSGDSSGFAGASRGVTPLKAKEAVKDSSRATALEGLSSLFELTNKAVDLGIKEDIDRRSTEAQDQIFREFGADDVTTIEGLDTNSEPVPGEISRAERNLSRLTQANKQGAVSDNSYWARVNTVSRQLRARYPGHRDYIDQKVSSLAGGKPQNEIVRNVINAAQKAQEGSGQEAKAYMQFVEELTKSGTLPADWSIDKYPDRSSLIRAAGPAYRDKFNRDREVAEINAAKGRRESVTLMVEDSANKTAQDMVFKTMTDMTTAIGKDYTEVNTKLQELRSRNTPATSEEIDAVRNQMSRLKQSHAATVERVLLENYGADLPNAKRKEIVEASMFNINRMEEALVNKDIGQFSRLHDSLQYQKESDDRTLLTKAPGARALSSVSRNLGPQIGEMYLNVTKGMDSVRSKVGVSAALDDMFDSGLSVKGALDKANNKGFTAPDTARAILKAPIDTLLNPKSDIDLKKRAVSSLFGSENATLIQSIKDTDKTGRSQKAFVFNQIVNPETHKAMVALKNSGDTDSWEKYTKWTTFTFDQLFRQSSNTIAEVAKEEGFTVKWNSQTSNFEADVSAQGKAGVNGGVDQFGNPYTIPLTLPASVKTAVTNMNAAVKSMIPIINENGMKSDEFLSNIYRSLPKEVFPQPMKLGGPNPSIDGTTVVDTKTGFGITPESNRVYPGQFSSGVSNTKGLQVRGQQVDAQTGDALQLEEISNLIRRKQEDLNLFGQLQNEGNMEGADQVDKLIGELTDLIKERDSIQKQWIEQYSKRLKGTIPSGS